MNEDHIASINRGCPFVGWSASVGISQFEQILFTPATPEMIDHTVEILQSSHPRLQNDSQAQQSPTDKKMGRRKRFLSVVARSVGQSRTKGEN